MQTHRHDPESSRSSSKALIGFVPTVQSAIKSKSYDIDVKWFSIQKFIGVSVRDGRFRRLVLIEAAVAQTRITKGESKKKRRQRKQAHT